MRKDTQCYMPETRMMRLTAVGWAVTKCPERMAGYGKATLKALWTKAPSAAWRKAYVYRVSEGVVYVYGLTCDIVSAKGCEFAPVLVASGYLDGTKTPLMAAREALRKATDDAPDVWEEYRNGLSLADWQRSDEDISQESPNA